MTQKELNALINNDSYHLDREKPSEADIRLYLREVNFHCPLCGKELQSNKQKKTNKLFEIAHIYPHRPTVQQYKELHMAERLGLNSESYENKIALCKDCHDTQDYHTTLDDYQTLLQIKKKCLLASSLDDLTKTLGLEDQIIQIIDTLSTISEDELFDLNYSPVEIKKKFKPTELSLKTKVTGYVLTYYPFIREHFRNIEGKNGFHFSVLSSQIRNCYIKMTDLTEDKAIIFSHLTQWLKNRTLCASTEACEIVVSFFVQNCEVFDEISK